MAKIEDVLKGMADMGPGLNAVFGAAGDILESIRSTGSTEGKTIEMLTGDPVADAAILRTLGVEKTIKDKWNVDLCDVLDLLTFLCSSFTQVSDFFKE